MAVGQEEAWVRNRTRAVALAATGVALVGMQLAEVPVYSRVVLGVLAGVALAFAVLPSRVLLAPARRRRAVVPLAEGPLGDEREVTDGPFGRRMNRVLLVAPVVFLLLAAVMFAADGQYTQAFAPTVGALLFLAGRMLTDDSRRG